MTLTCHLCHEPILPQHLRFKAWDTDGRGYTVNRVYIHLYHVTEQHQ